MSEIILPMSCSVVDIANFVTNLVFDTIKLPTDKKHPASVKEAAIFINHMACDLQCIIQRSDIENNHSADSKLKLEQSIITI